MWTINLKTYLAILVISSVIGYTAKGKIIYVDANVAGGNNVLLAKFQPDLQYPSIQAAIDAALDGDIGYEAVHVLRVPGLPGDHDR